MAVANNVGETSATHGPGRRARTLAYRRTGGLWVLVATVGIALSACAGPSPSHVASLGKSGGDGNASTTTTRPMGNPTVLLDQWAACMRSHGDPKQADPTIDANGVIHITWDPAIPGGYEGTNKGGQGNLGPGQYCREYLTQAQTALRGGQSIEMPSQAQLVRFAECMRASGIPDYPDPVDGNLSINRGVGGDLNPDNRTFQHASKVCVQKTGAHVPGAAANPPPGTIELNGADPPGSGGSGAAG